MEGTALVTLVVIGVVLVIGVVSYFSSRVGVAAPLALTIVGVAIGAIPGVPRVEIEPEIILTIVLPPLLYAAARQVPFVDFRRNLRVIAFLAVGLVAISAALVGILVHLLWAVPLALALALGAVVAPPDAVAATSLGKRLGLPPRIVTILEGEGLVNDATALVLLSTALGIAATTAAEIDGWGIALAFVWAVLGAVLIGGALALLALLVRKRITDGVLDTAVALTLPFAAFLAGEIAQASGVVAVVVAGILMGNQGAFRIRAAFRVSENATWRVVTVLLENAVFLYMGFLLWPTIEAVAADGDLPSVLGLAGLVIVLLVAVRFAVMPALLSTIRHRYRRRAEQADRVNARIADLTEDDFTARAVSFQQLGVSRNPVRQALRGLRARLGLVTERDRVERDRLAARWAEIESQPAPEVDDATRERVAGRFRSWRRRLDQRNYDLSAERDQALGWRDGVILGMAGMRGVVTVAAVQTIPASFPGRDGLVLIAFTVATVTLVVQGLLLPMVVRRLRPAADIGGSERAETLALRRLMKEAGDTAVARRIAHEGDVSPRVVDEVRDWSDTQLERLEVWATTDIADPNGEIAQFRRLRRTELDAQRAALREQYELGAFSSEAIDRIRASMDAEEISLDQLDEASGG